VDRKVLGSAAEEEEGETPICCGMHRGWEAQMEEEEEEQPYTFECVLLSFSLDKLLLSPY